MSPNGPSVLVGPISVPRAYEELAAALRERILSGELGAGHRLPSEGALGSQAGVSRSTVREALRILEQAGYVERSSPRVMVVADRSANDAFTNLEDRRATFQDLYEALMTIDPELTRLAVARADRAAVGELQKVIHVQEQHLADPAEWSRLDVEFHSIIADLSGSSALIMVRRSIDGLLLPTLTQFMVTSDLTSYATKYHRRIADEFDAPDPDPDTAAAVARRHINDWRRAWEESGLGLRQELGSVKVGSALQR